MKWKPTNICTPGASCEIEYDQDPTSDARTFIRTISKCAIHNKLNDDEILETCIEESRRIEMMRHLTYELGAKRILTTTEKETLALVNAARGDVAAVPDAIWNPDVKFDISYDEDRHLTVVIDGVDAAKKTEISDAPNPFPPEWNIQKAKVTVT